MDTSASRFRLGSSMLSILFAASFILLMACDGGLSEEEQDRAQQQEFVAKKQSLAARDFSSDFEGVEYYDPAKPDPEGTRPMVRMILDQVRKGTTGSKPVAQMTENERRRMGVYEAEGSPQPISYMGTLAAVMQAYDKTGQIPADALDLLEQTGYLDQASIDKIIRMEPGARISQLGVFVDPVTHKLFSSFSTEGWQPLGVSVESVPKEQWKDIYPESRGHAKMGDGNSQEHVFHYTLYGETPGLILQSGYIPFTAHEGLAAEDPGFKNAQERIRAAQNGDPIPPRSSEPNPCNPCSPDNPCNPCSSGQGH